jgi:hypothetical protein
MISSGRAIAAFLLRRPRFYPRSYHVGFVVSKVAVGRAFSEYFGPLVNPHSTHCITFIKQRCTASVVKMSLNNQHHMLPHGLVQQRYVMSEG